MNTIKKSRYNTQAKTRAYEIVGTIVKIVENTAIEI